jgi:hypothetical protein
MARFFYAAYSGGLLVSACFDSQYHLIINIITE